MSEKREKRKFMERENFQADDENKFECERKIFTIINFPYFRKKQIRIKWFQFKKLNSHQFVITSISHRSHNNQFECFWSTWESQSKFLFGASNSIKKNTHTNLSKKDNREFFLNNFLFLSPYGRYLVRIKW